jgi:hypothetical protein
MGNDAPESNRPAGLIGHGRGGSLWGCGNGAHGTRGRSDTLT